ncbi:MAG: alkaline phosphatase family protein [Bryobacteraceae bacterium]
MSSPKVLLVGWDAADWKVIYPLMAAGKMPNIERLTANGVAGQIATLHPPLSPMLWTSIATGKRPFKHGIHGFSEPTRDGRGIRPVTNLSRKSKALWNILNQNGLRSMVIGWWPSHPAEPINGVMVSDHYHRARGPLNEGWPMQADTVHPPQLSATLAALRVHPEQLAPSTVERFIPLAREIDQDQDNRLAMCLRTLAECMSIQAAASWLLDNQPWDFCAVYFEAIDHFSHAFMRYHPPRQSWISEQDFELYHHVVSTAYQFHDEMLGSLLSKTGKDATVILLSDHGFHPDHLRTASIPNVPAGPAVEHRDFGILAMSGPGMKKHESLHGASVLDIAPTILSVYGLPYGEDMDGRVLMQAFATPPDLMSVASWEEIPGPDGCHPPHARLDPVAAHAALEQMIALGYIERPDQNRELAVQKTLQELRYNLGEAYQDAGRHIEAREIFNELHNADAAGQRFAFRLFVSCQALGLHAEMQKIVADLERRGPCPPNSGIEYLKAQIAVAEKRFDDALRLLEAAVEIRSAGSAILLQRAELYLRLRRREEAEKTYKNILETDPDNMQAHVGLSRVALARGEFGLAADSALDALQRVHHDPLAHFLLGRALKGLKSYERAAEAFRNAISFNPNFPEAHLHLARLLEKMLGDDVSAREHRTLAHSMRGIPATLPAGRLASRGGVRTDGHPTLRQCSSGAQFGHLAVRPDSLIIVTGLPRSGTSLLMQMLAAGGVQVLTDEVRGPDEDNPRGYFEYEPVKNLLTHSRWLFDVRAKAVKIVAPLLTALPPGLDCHVILCQRDLNEVLDSQEKMLLRRGQPAMDLRDRRRLLRTEYERVLAEAKTKMARRPATLFMDVEYSDMIAIPEDVASKIDRLLGGGLAIARMAAAVEPGLHRSRAGIVAMAPAAASSSHPAP